MIKNKSLQIGEIADKTGVSSHTLRYYEKLGLIQKPSRSTGGFRLYPPQDVEKITFIKKAQSFGLTLEEIKTIMGCSKQGLNPCCDLIMEVFTKKITEFESKIKEMQHMRRRLKCLVSEWSTKQ